MFVCVHVSLWHRYMWYVGMFMYVQRAGKDVCCSALSLSPYFVDAGSLTDHEYRLRLLLEL